MFANLIWIEIIYWVCVIMGGTLFILRTIMMLISGGVDHGDLDLDLDGTADIPHLDLNMDAGDLAGDQFGDHFGEPAPDHADTDTSFKFLSVQGVTGFFMIFGLVGLAMFHSGLHVLVTIVGALVAGLFTMLVISLVFAQMKKLQSEGTLKLRNAIGQTGTVYLTIPAADEGKVQIIIQGGLKFINAVSRQENPIRTGAKVRVIDAIGDHTLVVEEIP